MNDEELQNVSGGTRYRDVFVFKQKNGSYKAIGFDYDGSEAVYKKLFATASKGNVPDLVFGLNSTKEAIIGAQDYGNYMSLCKQDGYTIRTMF